MIDKVKIFFAALLFAAPAPVSADTFGSAERTLIVTMGSLVLDEKRDIYVRTPPNYDPEKKYPVVYVLDGEWNFEYVASYLDYMMDNEVYPDVIVTGARNINRNRDYVSAPDANFADTGGADKFLKFVEDEWVGYIEKHYPVTKERVLIGHSFGGVFTLHTLFKKPTLFNAYIALGASAWIADRILFDEADAFFEQHPNADQFVYMAVGEGDGGPTVPSSRDLAKKFEARAPASLEWTFDVTPKADHFKNFATGMHDGFMALFPAWNFKTEVMAIGAADGSAGVDQWFDEKREALGYRFKPAWFDLGVGAIGLARADRDGAAISLISQLQRYYPDNPHVASFAGSVFEITGDHRRAADEYDRAAAIARDKKLHPNVIHIDRLLESAARNRAAVIK